MRFKLLTIAAACALLASAQDVRVARHEQLLQGTSGYNPVLSDDGQKLLFSGEDYKGLSLYDFADGSVERISDDVMAGFEPAFSADGASVFYLSQTRDDMRVYREMKACDLESGVTSLVAGKSRGMMSPVAVDGGVAVVSDNGRLMKAHGAAAGAFAYSQGAEIVVVSGGVEKKLAPVATKYTYLWTSLSPDRTRILFYAGGKGAYVCDLEGNILASLGRYTSPRWMGNDYVVATCSTDDGHRFLTSQIVLLKADGSLKKELTTPDSMTMDPSASAVGNRIVYSSLDGRMYVMELTVE